MTKVRGGIESMLSGKFGNMVFVQRDGKTYIRRAPRRKKNSSTPRMLLNQKRFGEIIRFCSLFKTTAIPLVWNRAAQGTSGYRLFQKTNSPAFGPDGSLLDPKLLRLSTGTLTLPQGFTAGRAEAGGTVIEVGWPEDEHLGGLSLQDELMAISASEGQYSDVLTTGILRGQLTGTFELPELPVQATHLYLFFGSWDRRDYSESVCVKI